MHNNINEQCLSVFIDYASKLEEFCEQKDILVDECYYVKKIIFLTFLKY